MRRLRLVTHALAIAMLMILVGSSAGIGVSAAPATATPITMGTPDAANQAGGQGVSIRITVHTCKDGVDPEKTPDACTKVISAPEAARLTAAPDAIMPLSRYPVDAQGSYLVHFDTVPGDGSVGLVGFAPADFNYFTFTGVDENGRWQASIDLKVGDQREVKVYYWNGSKGLIEPGENAVTVAVFDCPDGVNPQVDASACTKPVPSSALTGLTYTSRNAVGRDDGTFADLGPTADGTYSFPNLAPYTKFGVYDDGTDRASSYVVNGDVEEVRSDNGGGTAYLVRGESREITVYRTSAPDTGTPSSPGEGETGTIRVTLVSCPPDVTTRKQVEAGACTTPIKDDGTARVFNNAVGVDVPLTNYPYEDGSYVLADVPVGAWYFSDLEPVSRDAVHTIGQDEIHGGNYGIHLGAGENRELIVAYFNGEK
ncbi:MAG: hypothetical protein ACR2OE_17105 [Thermomicrobiales bacterium]